MVSRLLNKANREEWIEVANIIAPNSRAKVRCPNCEYEYLSVQEVVISDKRKKDIYLICSSCGSRNVVTVNV